MKMFRCKECQAEYEIKPDYCDCGNDTFEEIMPQIVQKTEYKKEIKEPEIKEIKISKPKKNNKPFFEPISTIFFIVCVILSFIIIFFVGNPQNEIQKSDVKEPEKLTTNIPNIDKFWNNSLPKNEVEQIEVKPEVVETVQPLQQKKILPQMSVSQNNVVNVKPQIVQPKQITKQTTQNKQVTIAQPKAQTVVKTQPVQQMPVATTLTQPVVNKQELANYKIGLRNKIAQKINFANVIGDGSCVVSFNISNSGVLQNRKFKKQSDNFTLNDVVYNALMQTPSYNPPPVGYKNETMNLNVKMSNGHFEVSLY